MAPVDIASDLAAAWYATMLRPDPNLDAQPDPAALSDYQAHGQRILDTLRAQPRAVIRCGIAPRPGQRPRALATVHDRWLLVIQDFRGPNAFGLRLVRHLLVDTRMAQREGHRAVTTFCPAGDRHELPFRWLRSTRGFAISERFDGPFYKAPGTYLDREYNPAPEDERHAYRQAFAITTGPLDATFFVALPWIRAAWWWTRYGPDEAHRSHLDRLTARYDFRAETPHGATIPTVTWTHPDAVGAEIRRVEDAHR